MWLSHYQVHSHRFQDFAPHQYKIQLIVDNFQ
jgi:hypothetical protein